MLGVPEWQLSLAWVASALSFASWFLFGLQASNVDVCVILAAHVAILPILHARSEPSILCALGFLVIGLAIGFQLVDLCFDVLIIWDLSVHDTLGIISGRKIAWLYYNTMLNSRHINLALSLFLLVGQFVTLVGITRSTGSLRRKWIALVCNMIFGNGGYFIVVIPCYVAIRSSVAFDAQFFDGWMVVLIARMVLFAALGSCATIAGFMLVDLQSQVQPLHPHEATTNGKTHEE